MKPNDAAVIEVVDFAKNYGDFAAVRELSFTVRPGEIVGLVGANGAGKTTTLRAITGILRPTRDHSGRRLRSGAGPRRRQATVRLHPGHRPSLRPADRD